MSLCLACSMKEDAFEVQTNDGVFQFNAAVADFSEHNVSTKASDEADINELTMFIFTETGDIVGRPVNIEGNNPTFLISTTRNDELNQFPYIWDPNATGEDQFIKIEHDDDKLHYCDIYMVANAWDALKDVEIKTLTDLKAISIPVSGIDIPEGGFPMIGKQDEGITFDLASEKLPETTSGTTLATITMKKLYAKVNFRFRLIADQVVATPTFTLTDWQVCNIPGTVAFGEPAAGETTANSAYIAASQASNILTSGDRTIDHTVSGSDAFEFAFYMPEHYLYADKTVAYPDGMPEENRQRYKPLMCSNSLKPTYVKVRGSYKDHQGNAKEVTYYVYLGQDAVSDFCVKRNQLLNNIVTIKGTTDSNPYYEDGNLVYPDNYDPSGDNISIDHRVEIGSEGFVISLEREAVMDSHFEVRPMDIVVSEEAKVVVTIDDASNTDPAGKPWMRFEASGSTDAHISGVGVRKYFTSDLVTSTLAGNTTMTITEDTRLWLYFDENTNVYDSYLDTDEANPLPKWRDIQLKVDYYAPGNDSSTPTKQNVYTFRQWHLWRIRDKSNTRYYDIEHEEEYLYNYVSDDNYGKTTDGMAWGLNGITFSGNMGDDLKTQSIIVDASGNTFGSIIDYVIDNLSPFYDFYLPREAELIDNSLVNQNNSYAGRRFTNAMIDYAGIDDIKRLLTEDPESAIEYCFNKNKRNNDGEVPTRNWYLPAIDEIEQIMVGGYSEFEVFQDKLYWSCQPAYYMNYLHYKPVTGTDIGGDYYTENIYSARSTSALYVQEKDDYTFTGSAISNGGYYQYLPTSISSILGSPNPTTITGAYTFDFKIKDNLFSNDVYETRTLNKADYDIGYNNRLGKINRIRCVRNSGSIQ